MSVFHPLRTSAKLLRVRDMPWDAWDKVTVAQGVWKYDDAVDQPVRIVGLPYDYWYSMGEADDQLEAGETPEPLGPDGLLYYVVFAQLGGPGFPTMPKAKAYARSQIRSEIRWL